MLMDIFFTCKNGGPESTGPAHTVYFGNDFSEALNAVDPNFRRYQVDWEEYKRGRDYLYIYSALPRNVDWEMVRFYSADGWWYSIVKVQLSPTIDPKAAEPSHNHTMPFRP